MLELRYLTQGDFFCKQWSANTAFFSLQDLNRSALKEKNNKPPAQLSSPVYLSPLNEWDLGFRMILEALQKLT